MALFRVLLTDRAWPDVALETEVLDAIDAELVTAKSTDVITLAAAARDADAIMTTWASVTADVIDAAPKCRIIARMGVGLDNIDVAHATSRGIVVTNVPDYCATEVAEHTMALLLALARKVALFHLQTKSGAYDLQAGLPIRRVAGKTLGIIGTGRIGRAVAQRARALELEVIGCSRRLESVPPDVAACSLDAALERSDFVSLHVPLVAETRGLIGAPQLARMKPSAFLINTARGGLVDHQALAAALRADRLAGAALDTQDPEPPDLARPPYSDPRVIVTPHAAFASSESLVELRQRAARQVANWLTDQQPEHVVNPEVLG